MRGILSRSARYLGGLTSESCRAPAEREKRMLGLTETRSAWLGMALAAVIASNYVQPAVSLGAAFVALTVFAFCCKHTPVISAVIVFGDPLALLFSLFIPISPTALRIAASGIGAVLLFWDMFLAKRPEPRRVDLITLIWLAAVILLLLLGYILDINNEYGEYKVTYAITYGLVYFVAGTLMRRPSRQQIVMWVAAGVVCYSCTYAVAGHSPEAMLRIHSVDPIGLRAVADRWFDAIATARLSGLLILVGVGVMMQYPRRGEVIAVGLGALLLGTPVAYLSQTRQVVVAISLGACALVLFTLFRRQARSGAPPGLGAWLVHRWVHLVVIGALAWAVYSIRNESAYQGRYSQLHLLTDTTRANTWREAAVLIEQRPLTGWGLGAFSLKTGYPWPHNYVLEWWLEFGLIGVLIAIVILSRVLYNCYSHRNTEFLAVAIGGLYCLCVVQLSADTARNMLLVFFSAIGTPANATRLGRIRMFAGPGGSGAIR